MDSASFLESCSLANEQESQRVDYLPSLAEIEVLKRRIRAEKGAREALKHSGPPHLKMYRQPKVVRTEYSQGRIRTD
jgi:hypothetical protein